MRQSATGTPRRRDRPRPSPSLGRAASPRPNAAAFSVSHPVSARASGVRRSAAAWTLCAQSNASSVPPVPKQCVGPCRLKGALMSVSPLSGCIRITPRGRQNRTWSAGRAARRLLPTARTRRNAAQPEAGGEQGLADWMGQPGSCGGGCLALRDVSRQRRWPPCGGRNAAPTRPSIPSRRLAATRLHAGLGLAELGSGYDPRRLPGITETEPDLDEAIAADARAHRQRHARMDDLEIRHLDALAATRDLTPGGESSGAKLGAQRGTRASWMTSRSAEPVTPSMRSAVFQRFYRLDASRTTRGGGLGLSLVAAILDLQVQYQTGNKQSRLSRGPFMLG